MSTIPNSGLRSWVIRRMEQVSLQPVLRGLHAARRRGWNPHFDGDCISGKLFGHDGTVIRGGYARAYGRTNGVDQVLVPLLGVGLEQPVACNSNLASAGSPGNWACGGSGVGTY